MPLKQVWDFNSGTLQGWELESGSQFTITDVWTGTKGLYRYRETIGVSEREEPGIYITLDLSQYKRPILLIPHYIKNDFGTSSTTTIRVYFETPTKSFFVDVVGQGGGGSRYGVAILDIPRLFGDNNWKTNVTIRIRIYLYNGGASKVQRHRTQIDSLALFDGPDSLIYLPTMSSYLKPSMKTVVINEEIEPGYYLSVFVLSGHTKTKPPTYNITINYDRSDTQGNTTTIQPALVPFSKSGHYSCSAYDTSAELAKINSIAVEILPSSTDRLDKYSIGIGAMTSEWLVVKLFEILHDIHEYPFEEDVDIVGNVAMDTYYTRYYYHRTLSTLYLDASVEGTLGDLGYLSGTHSIEFYDPITNSLIDDLYVVFPSLTVKQAVIPAAYYYDAFGTHLIASEHILLSNPSGTDVGYYLYLLASCLGAVASIDGIV